MSSNETFNETFTGGFNSTFNSTFNGTNGTYTNGTHTEFEEKVEVLPVSFYTPLIYITILILSLLVFARRYKQNRIQKITGLDEIFDEQDAKDFYFEIKELSTTQKIHEKVIKAALLNRGAEAIRRSLKLKELQPQIELIYKSGSVDEDYWVRFQAEVKFIEIELRETVQEAEALHPGWAKLFVGLSQEICFNQALRRRYQSIAQRKADCISEWELKLNEDGTLAV